MRLGVIQRLQRKKSFTTRNDALFFVDTRATSEYARQNRLKSKQDWSLQLLSKRSLAYEHGETMHYRKCDVRFSCESTSKQTETEVSTPTG